MPVTEAFVRGSPALGWDRTLLRLASALQRALFGGQSNRQPGIVLLRDCEPEGMGASTGGC
jgi:hypothetical protein